MKGIYMIKNIINNKVYIGLSANMIKRKKQHFNALNRGEHENDRLQKAFNKYGEEAFIFEILVKDNNISIEDLFKFEEVYIRLFDTMNRKVGYNLCLGGKGSLGWTATDEQKRNRAIKFIGKGNPFYGKKVSQSHRDKMNEGIRKTSQTEEYKKKMSKAMKGRQFTEEHRKNKSEAQRGSKNPIARSCSIDGVEFETIQMASDILGIRHNTISWRLNSTSERFKDWFYTK